MFETKTERSHFFSALFDKETARLDELSREGWQLTYRTMASRHLVYDPTVQYRYAFDCRSEHNEEMYLSLLQEAGWETVSVEEARVRFLSMGKWYFFRKAYDPALPEEAYQLFTDEESFIEMKDRSFSIHWGGLVFLWLWGISCIIQLLLLPEMRSLLHIFTFALICATYSITRKLVQTIGTRKTVSPKWRIGVLAIGLALAGCCFCAADYYEDHQFSHAESELYSAPYTRNLSSMDISVPRPDFYTLSLIAHPDVPTTITFTNSKGKTLARFVNNETHSERYRLFLWPGEYTITTDFYPFDPPTYDDGYYHYYLYDSWLWF